MNFNQRLLEVCRQKKSLVCIGLDIDLNKVPEFILHKAEPLEYFGKAIIDATIEFAAAYKLNTAFFEAYGVFGWKAMTNLVSYLPNNVIKIADGKRGDIGNTSSMYARAFFEDLSFDAMTVNPYLGYDGIEPFIKNKEKGIFVLCHTTNKGAEDFQKFSDGNKKLFERVAEKVNQWNQNQNCGLVVGATYPAELQHIRTLAPDLPFLVPGLGAQGGDFDLAIQYATNELGEGAIFNFSRSIIYSSGNEDFAKKAGEQAKKMQEEINLRRQK